MGQPIQQQQLNADVAAHSAVNQPKDRILRAALKVPEITVYFWIVKLLSTALGESTSDYLVFHLSSPYIAVALGTVAFIATLLLQFYVRRYIAWVYWLAVVMVAVFGTMAADVLHIQILTPLLNSSNKAYLVATIFFAGCLAVIFLVWYFVEKTLSIHSITTFRRELFYWATVVTTFALGTAAGDMTASTLHLGYFVSGLLFIALFELPALGYFMFRLNEVMAFWFAYIITRPLGASFADWFGKDTHVGGLGIGDGPVSLVLAILIIGIIGYLSVTRKDVQANSAYSSN